MDFFEAQDRARRRTTPLVLLFCLAVAGTIAGLYFAFVGCTAVFGLRANAHGGGLESYPDALRRGLSGIDWWQPGALKAIALLVLPTIGFSTLFKWVQLRAGGSAVAADVGGRRVEPDTADPRERMLLNVVEEMAIASGMAVPAVFILPAEASINAFAAGYTRSDAAVAVTRGALERLSRDELQGVIAHEFSHILNGDMRINTRLVSLLFGILSLVILGRGLLRAAFHSDVSDTKGGAVIVVPFAVGGIALIVVGGSGLLAGRFIQAAVSRQREYLADAAAVQFTRNPGGLAGALKKLGASPFGGRLSHPSANEVGHFCFAQNFRSAFDGLFATHPPLEERIRLLDPAFDGRYPELPPIAAPRPAPPPPQRRPAPHTTHAPRPSPAAVVATAGIINLDTLHAAQGFIASLPDELHDAAHDPASISALACAVCLPPDLPGPARTEALAVVARLLGAPVADRTRLLHDRLAALLPSAGLSVLQLAAPALRELDATARDALLGALDEIVHADGVVTPREFALQKILARDLRLADRPREALRDVAPGAASPHLSIALSAAARVEADDENAAAEAFARAAAGFNGLHPPLAYLPPAQTTLGHLDLALDRLALTPAPFRKRILLALAAAFAADQKLAPAEEDMLRALAAALDCPLPPALPISPA